MFKPLRPVIPSILLILFIAIGVSAAERPSGLTIDDRGYSSFELASDISGNGWSWNAETNQLILNGFNGYYIGCSGDLDLVLADGSLNTLTDEYINAVNAVSIRISGKGSLRAETMVYGYKGVVVEGGTLYCRSIYADDTSAVVSINGGHVTAAGLTFGILAPNVSIDGVDTYVSASGVEGAFNKTSILVNGTQTQTYNWTWVVYQNAQIINKSKPLTYLEIGGAHYDADSLESDFSGDGWSWDASGQKLTLSGYNGERITGGGSLQVDLVSGTTSSAPIACNNGLTISGSGTLSVSDLSEGLKVATGNLTISDGHVEITITGNSYSSEGLYAGTGNINVTGGNVTISGGYYGMRTNTGNIAITGGTVRVKSNGICLIAEDSTYTNKGNLTISGAQTNALLIGNEGVTRSRSSNLPDCFYWYSAVYQNGELVNLYLPRQVMIDDSVYKTTDLLENKAGDQWQWDAQKKEFTLDGYSGSRIEAKSGNLTINLMKDTTNIVVSRDYNYPAVGLNGDGAGTLTIKGSGTLIAMSSSTSGIGSSVGSLAISGGVIMTNQTDPVSPAISNALLFVGDSSDYSLAGSATITDDITLPKDFTFIVPEGRSIAIEGAGSMWVRGTLVNNGSITGKVLDADGKPRASDRHRVFRQRTRVRRGYNANLERCLYAQLYL
jgi:hypothetical protein